MPYNYGFHALIELPPGLPDPALFARNSYVTAIPQILLYTAAIISISFLVRFIKSLQG
jgi:multisubunit Na+/H+ antiporter MnhC subunit